MKNAITLKKAQEIQRALAARGHRIKLELLTDCATIPEEDEEADFIALSPATHTEDRKEIPKAAILRAAYELQTTLAISAGVILADLLDAGTEEGNAALCNGYATHGAIDYAENCMLWAFLPLQNS